MLSYQAVAPTLSGECMRCPVWNRNKPESHHPLPAEKAVLVMLYASLDEL